MKEKTAGQSPAYLLSEKENSPPVVLLSAGQLVPFPGHPFRVAEDGELELLMESIREYGVLTPLLARPKGDGSFELISGHRRKMACEKMGIEKIPVLVRELTDEEAVIRMVDSNIQRERVLPSEKAFAYKMKYEALKRKAGRPSKDNPRQVGANFRADEAVAENLSVILQNRVELGSGYPGRRLPGYSDHLGRLPGVFHAGNRDSPRV